MQRSSILHIIVPHVWDLRLGFGLCSSLKRIVSLFCGRSADSLINRTTKRAMRIIYKSDIEKALDALLQRERTFTKSQENLKTLMVEIHSTISHSNRPYMWDIFTKKVMEYDFRIKIRFKLPPARSQRYGTNSLRFKGSLLWNSPSIEIKVAKSFVIFKQKI